MQQVFVFLSFFGEIDGSTCKSNCIKGGCSRVQLTQYWMGLNIQCWDMYIRCGVVKCGCYSVRLLCSPIFR